MNKILILISMLSLNAQAITRREAYLHVKKLEKAKHEVAIKDLVESIDELIDKAVAEGKHGLKITVDFLYVDLLRNEYANRDFDTKVKYNELYIRWYPL